MILAGLSIGLYGLITFIGGLVGYFKADSVVSLVVGSIAGIGLLVCSGFLAKGSRLAALVALTISFLIGGRFLMAFCRTGTLMPHLLMIASSCIGAIASSAALRILQLRRDGQAKKKQPSS